MLSSIIPLIIIVSCFVGILICVLGLIRNSIVYKVCISILKNDMATFYLLPSYYTMMCQLTKWKKSDWIDALYK